MGEEPSSWQVRSLPPLWGESLLSMALVQPKFTCHHSLMVKHIDFVSICLCSDFSPINSVLARTADTRTLRFSLCFGVLASSAAKVTLFFGFFSPQPGTLISKGWRVLWKLHFQGPALLQQGNLSHPPVLELTLMAWLMPTNGFPDVIQGSLGQGYFPYWRYG